MLGRKRHSDEQSEQTHIADYYHPVSIDRKLEISAGSSKIVLERKLHDARIARHTGSLRGAGHAAEIIRIANVQARRAQIDVIEGIKELRAKLQLMRFREAEVLRGGSIHLIQSRQVNRMSRRRSKAARLR